LKGLKTLVDFIILIILLLFQKIEQQTFINNLIVKKKDFGPGMG